MLKPLHIVSLARGWVRETRDGEERLNYIRCQEPGAFRGQRELQMEGWLLERTCRQEARYQGGAQPCQAAGSDGHSSLREESRGVKRDSTSQPWPPCLPWLPLSFKFNTGVSL